MTNTVVAAALRAPVVQLCGLRPPQRTTPAFDHVEQPGHDTLTLPQHLTKGYYSRAIRDLGHVDLWLTVQYPNTLAAPHV